MTVLGFSVSGRQARQATYSLIDQACAVGGMFLVNVALARTQEKAEYGLFTLSYSVFTFLAGLHNASILESYAVYGSGRYNSHLSEFTSKLWQANLRLASVLTLVLLSLWFALRYVRPELASQALLGLALSAGVLLSASFLRQTFYVRRMPVLSARFSSAYFAGLLLLLVSSLRVHLFNTLTAFLVVGAAWLFAFAILWKEVPGLGTPRHFDAVEPNYWAEHWKYARWVVATAFIFQATNQAYYWLVAGFLSLKDVAALRAMYILVAPVDQIFVAISFIVLPMMAFQWASRNIDGMLSLWRKFLALSISVTAICAVMAQVLGRWFMHRLYGGRFDDVAPLLGVLAVLPIIMGIGNTMNVALKAAEKPGFVFYAYLASGATTFLAGVPLVAHLGLAGAVYGLLLSALAYTCASGIAMLRYVRPRATRPKLVNAIPVKPGQSGALEG